MSKRIALKDSITVDGVDLSNFASAIQLHSDDEQVDVSGFNATGADEFLAGKRTQSVDVTFFGAYGSGETHDTLYPLYRDRVVFTFAWRPDQTAVAGPDNPSLGGNVQLLSYGPGASRGAADSFQVTFTAADEAGLVFAET